MTIISPDRIPVSHSQVSASGRARTKRGRRGTKGPGDWRYKVVASAVVACFSAGVALANPVGPTVVAGQASFNQQGSALTVTNSANAIIHWQSFSIAPAELTRFIQPSASSAVLNRVMGGMPSEILGALQSNGRVFIINPSGILFGAGARIDVAGLVASTLDLTNQDFLAGKLRFVDTPGAGNLVNLGAIRTGARGSVYLIAPNVENSGLITSPQGEIILAAGKSVELVDVGTPDLRVLITAPDNQAVNLGSVVAESGRIGIYAGLINQKGLVNADTAVVGENGKIYFKAKDITLAPGSVATASGTPGGVKDGGEVRIVADGTLAMQKGSEVHADGGVDGGNGGFLELSGRERIGLNGAYTVRAQKAGYRGGTLLLDPLNIRIVTGGADLPPGTSTESFLNIDPANINQVGASNVTLAATIDLTVDSTITAANLRGGTPSLGTTLNLNAGNGVDINASILFDPDQRLNVNAGVGGISTPDTGPTIQAGFIDFRATGPVTIGSNTSMLANGSFPRIDLVSRDRAVTVRPGATVLASGSGGVAQVNIVAGTFIQGDCVGFCGSFNAYGGALNAVIIDGSVTAVGTFGGEVNILGHSVTVAGTVHAEGRNGNFADVGIGALNSAVIGSNSFNTTSPLDTSNLVNINGVVTATGGDTSVEILGGNVNVAGTVSATVNSGIFGSATVAVGAFSSFSSSSSSGSVSAGADNKVTIGGTLSAQGPRALVAVGGGSIEVQSGARIEAIASSGSGQVLMGSVSSASLSNGGLFDPFVVVNSFQATPNNELKLDGTVSATAAGGEGNADAAVRLVGGKVVQVAGEVSAAGETSARVDILAGSDCSFPASLSCGSTGNDISVGGEIYAGLLTPAGSGGVFLTADRIIGAGGTLNAGVGDLIGLNANNGIGAMGAPIRILDGDPIVIASTLNGDIAISQVNGTMEIGSGPGTSGRGFFSSVSTGTGSIDLSALGGGITVNSFLVSPLDLFLTAAGPVRVVASGLSPGMPALVVAGQDMGIVGTEFTVGSALVPGNAAVAAQRNLTATVAGPISVIGNGGLGLLAAGSNMGLTALGDLSVTAGPGSSAIVSADFLTGTVLGNTLIQGQGAMALAEMAGNVDIGSTVLPLTIFGTLRIDGTDGGIARMETGFSPDSIHLFFPLLASGGYFVNGVESQISDGSTGLFVNGLPAVLDENLFITFGVTGGGTVEFPAALIGDVNQAVTFKVHSGDQNGAPEDGEGKKKKPQTCS